MAHPLAGKRVVATRAEGQTAEFIALLREAGAVPIIFPTIEIVPLDDTAELDAALSRLGDYDWAIFTSINGVKHVMARIQALGKSPSDFNVCNVVAVGETTEAVIRDYGINVALRPAEYVAEAILAGLADRGPLAGKRFLLLRVDTARAVLRDQLVAAGGLVDEVAVYRTAIGNPDAAAYAELRQGADVITFTSSSTVRNFFALLGSEALSIASHARVACIGPITAQTAREYGLHVDVAASEYTVRGLMKALETLAMEN